jgi:MoxR-like ATPase
MRRIQFTPDLLPGDVVGVSVFNRETRDFEFKPGAVFANIVLGDEINRASPKTQSALLECMEEGQVTVDGTTYLLGRPFMVLATQNPSEMEGTYALPEAQRDRFMARVHMGYPDRTSEIQMLQAHSADEPLESLAPVTDAAEVRAMIDAVRQVYVAPTIDAYVVDLVSATRQHSHVRLGASPRAALHLLRAARASAALSGRGHVLPDDVQRLAVPVLAHRLVLTTDAHLSRTSAQDVVTEILTRVPLPASA